MVSWTDSLKKAHAAATIDVMLSLGHFTDGGLKTKHWTAIVQKFNEATEGEREPAAPWDKAPLQSALAQRKKEYKTYEFLQKQSGFGFDVDSMLVTAPDDCWERLIEAHPMKNYGQ